MRSKSKIRRILRKEEVFHKAAELRTERVMDGLERAVLTKMNDLTMKKIKKITNSQVVPKTQNMVAKTSLSIRIALDNQ